MKYYVPLPQRLVKEFVAYALLHGISKAVEHFRKLGYEIDRDKAVNLVQQEMIRMMKEEKVLQPEYGQRGVTSGFRIIRPINKKDEHGRDLCIEVTRRAGERRIDITLIPCPEWIKELTPPEEPEKLTEEEKERFRRAIKEHEIEQEIYEALEKSDVKKILQSLERYPDIFKRVITAFRREKGRL